MQSIEELEKIIKELKQKVEFLEGYKTFLEKKVERALHFPNDFCPDCRETKFELLAD